jgi:hypothetical protein
MIFVGQPLLAVPHKFGMTKAGRQECLSYSNPDTKQIDRF